MPHTGTSVSLYTIYNEVKIVEKSIPYVEGWKIVRTQILFKYTTDPRALNFQPYNISMYSNIEEYILSDIAKSLPIGKILGVGNFNCI